MGGSYTSPSITSGISSNVVSGPTESTNNRTNLASIGSLRTRILEAQHLWQPSTKQIQPVKSHQECPWNGPQTYFLKRLGFTPNNIHAAQNSVSCDDDVRRCMRACHPLSVVVLPAQQPSAHQTHKNTAEDASRWCHSFKHRLKTFQAVPQPAYPPWGKPCTMH